MIDEESQKEEFEIEEEEFQKEESIIEEELKTEKSFVEESLFNLKNGNENKNNEITQLKYLLKQKEEEIEEMGLEFEKIKNEFNTLNLNYIEVNQQIDYFKDIEKKYNELIPKFNLLKKNNEENIRTIQQNEKNINILNNKLYKKEIECNNLIKENELLKQDLIKLEHIENKYNELISENDELKNLIENYEKMKREYEIQLIKIKKLCEIEEENKELKEKLKQAYNDLKDLEGKYDSLLAISEENKNKYDKLCNLYNISQNNNEEMSLKITEYKSKYESILPHLEMIKKTNENLTEEKNKLIETIKQSKEDIDKINIMKNKEKLSDSNKNFVRMLIAILSKLIEAMKSGFKQWAKPIALALIPNLADKNQLMRNECQNCFDKWVEFAGFDSLVIHFPKFLTTDNVEMRIEIMNFFMKYKDKFNKSTGESVYKDMMNPLLICLQDRSSNVRNLSEEIIKISLVYNPITNYYKKIEDFKPAIAKTLKQTLDKLNKTVANYEKIIKEKDTVISNLEKTVKDLNDNEEKKEQIEQIEKKNKTEIKKVKLIE